MNSEAEYHFYTSSTISSAVVQHDKGLGGLDVLEGRGFRIGMALLGL